MGRRHEVVSSTLAFKGKILEVVVDRILLPDGTGAEREFVRHPGAVGMVAVDGESILMVRQNRHAVGEDLLEIPAGKLAPGEDPEECARRELQEETGYVCGKVVPLVRYFSSPGFTDEVIHLFMSHDLRQVGPPPASDEGEPIGVEWLRAGEVEEAVRSGRVTDAKSIIGLLLAVVPSAR